MCRADKVAFATLMRDFLVSLREYNCDQWTQASLSLQALILKSPLYVPLCSKCGRALTFQNVACSLRHSKKRLHGKRCVCIHCVCVCVCVCVRGARARVRVSSFRVEPQRRVLVAAFCCCLGNECRNSTAGGARKVAPKPSALTSVATLCRRRRPQSGSRCRASCPCCRGKRCTCENGLTSFGSMREGGRRGCVMSGRRVLVAWPLARARAQPRACARARSRAYAHDKCCRLRRGCYLTYSMWLACPGAAIIRKCGALTAEFCG